MGTGRQIGEWGGRVTLTVTLTLTVRRNHPKHFIAPYVSHTMAPAFESYANLTDVSGAGGNTTLQGYTVMEVVNYMLDPILRGMDQALQLNGRVELRPLIPKYLFFRLGLGMLRPHRVDDIWDKTSLNENAYLARLLSRQEYYDMVRFCKGNIQTVMEWCNETWAQGWTLGAAATGDETIVPFKGKRAGQLRQFVPRKPHSTGLKLYCLADSVHAYTTSVYLYTGRRGIMRHASSASGRNTPAEMMHRWADELPEGTTIIADSFFGTLSVAAGLHARGIPFLLLTKRNTPGVQALGAGSRPGEARTTVTPEGYHLGTYRNPKVGGKAARLVPFLTNCSFDNAPVRHLRGYTIPRMVYAYRQLCGGVDTANQLSLQHREVGRCSTWAQALRHFLIRYAVTNAFATCRVLDLVPQKETLRAFQWVCMKAICGQPMVKQVVTHEQLHVPIVSAKRGRCANCQTGNSQ